MALEAVGEADTRGRDELSRRREEDTPVEGSWGDYPQTMGEQATCPTLSGSPQFFF